MKNSRYLRPASQVSLALTALALTCLAPHAAMAQGVISSTGVHLLPTAPPNVKQGKIQSDTLTTAFQEQQNLTLINPLSVDISKAGTYATLASLTPGTVASGTKVDSFFFYSDPTNSTVVTTFTGSLTFDQNILGLVVLTKSLDQTDGLLGATGTVYPTGAPADKDRGLEFGGNPGDAVTLTVQGNTLDYNFHTSGAVDEVRVITSASTVPEPSPLVTFSLGALVLGGIAFARRKKASPQFS